MPDDTLTILRQMQAGAAWEIAKGHLRALAAIQGHERLTVSAREADLDQAENRWKRLNGSIEAFIRQVEDGELYR